MGLFDATEGSWARRQQERPRNSFENISQKQLDAHVKRTRYGAFQLTDAIRPAYDLKIVPRQGYRHDFITLQNRGVKYRIPMLVAAASREVLLDLLHELLPPLGAEVNLALETSHNGNQNGHEPLCREGIDMPVLQSTLYDFEDVLLNDGCAGLSVVHPSTPLAVEFDEHKLLIILGQNIKQFENILLDYNVQCDEEIKFINEAEHVHSSSDTLQTSFDTLRYRLGLEEN